MAPFGKNRTSLQLHSSHFLTLFLLQPPGVLVPVLPGSKKFDNSIRPPLQNSYMYKESKQSFRYNSAFLINNATLQERYEAFRTKRRDMGYTEEEMEESYGFLLFDDENKANRVGETGVVPGHSTCTTLGDPSKGVYVSKYSDCLDLNRWYHGKSGYITIIRLTKGRVREVTENYTVNYTSPSNGFDCHVSEQLSSVSANTSSFLAFERTQYYMYELPVGGAVQPPSHVCPFAIVAFSYWDTKTPASEEKEKRGQLQISSQIYHVGLKSSTGPLIPAKLPTMMSVDGAIQMSDLRQKLPKAIFETCFSGEVSLEGMGCSLYELSPSEAEDTSLSQLTQGLKEKDLALTIQLNDNGFLILLHSSHFLTYEDTGSSKPEVLQGMFVFPDSRAIHRDTKVCWKKPFLSPECLQVVPALNYAETEVEKCLPSPSGELRGLLEQHIQSYASLIHPGLTISPSREASIFPDQFDVPDALKYLYSAPKWTEMGWKRLKSYFHQPGSFELSVSRATELLVAGREERGDEPDDDVYYCLSSPEGSPMSPASLGGPEEQQSGGKSPGDTADTAMDVTQVHPLKMPRELMNLIQDPQLKKKEKMDVTQVHPLKMPRELMNLIQDPPLKKKEKIDVTQVHPLKMPRELMNLIQDPPLKMKSKDLIHYHPLRNKESMDLIHDDHPLKKKTERWDLKAIISECGRIFVPHGSEVIAKDIESLKVKGKVLDHKQCADEMMVEACIKVPQPIETGNGPNLELNKSDENKDLPIGMLDSKDSLHEVKMADVDTDSPSSGKHKKKRQYVAISLSQLKTVLSRGGKRNKPINPAPEDQTSPVNKKSKADTPGMDEMENVHINKANPDRTTGAVEVAKEQTFGLDPKFALALGLTPTELNNDAHKSPEKSDIALKKDIQIAISSQLVTLDPDVSRVVSRGRPCEGASAVSCPPAESLTLLADLARSTSNDKVLEQQSDPKALEKQDDHPSLVISDNSVKDGISPHDPDGEREFVLPALLKHPSAARLKLPPQSPSPKGLVVGSGERVVLVSQEHSYSLPPSSLLLGLSGSIVQVPISEGLQQHRKDIFADGTQTLRAVLCQQKDQNRKEPGLARESLSKGIGCRQKFHRFRRFIEKDGSVQVTRLWKENYNFNSDSKFTNDPKDKTVIRALHGPWDFDITDTKEQVQLIIHMWIGLFYSRSTARFCQADSSLTCLEKKESIEVAHGMVPAQIPPGTKTSSPAYIALSRIPEPDVLDLSKMGKKKAQPLSLEAEVLDLSMKTTSTVLDSLDTESKRRIDLKNHPSYLPASGLHKETISCPKQSTGVELKVLEGNNKKLLETQTAQVLEGNNKKLLETQTAQVLEGNNKKLLETQTAQVLEGNNKKLLQREEEMTGDGEPHAVCLKTMGSKDVNKEQQLKDNDSVKTMPCTEVQMDGDAANMADTVERNAKEARDGVHVVICDGSESKEEMHKVDHNVKDSVEAEKPEAVHAGKDTTNKKITKAQTAVHVGKDLIDNDKALKAVHSENVPRDYGNTKDQVQTAMQDGNDTRDETLPVVICGEDSGDKTPPVVCDGNTSVAETLPEISHTENDSQKATLAVVHGGNDLRDTTLPVKCNGKLYIDVEPTVVHDINGSTDEELPMGQGGDVSAGTSRVLPEMHGEIKCKDVLPTQVFPVCDGNMPFVGEFDTLIQPNNVLGVAKHEINEADVQTKEQEKELMQGQSKSDDVTTQSSTTFPPGSQHSQDETLERLTGQVEIPLIPREDIAHTDVLHLIGEASEMAQGQVEIPFIGVEIPFIGVEKNSQDINHTEVHDTPPSQKETLITVCDSANVLSGELLAKIFSKGTESVSRCPTVDEVLYGYIPIPDICSASLAICDADGVSKPLSTGEGYSRCPIPTEDEPPFVPGISYNHHTPNTVLLPNAKDTNSPNLDSGLALIENEKDHHEPSLSLYKARAATGLHNLHKSSNNNKPNNLEAIDNRFSQVLADPRKNPIATSTPLNTPSSSLKERSDYDPYSNTRLAAVEPDLHAHSSRHSLHSFSYSFPNTHCSLTEKAAFSVPSIHPEVLSNETTLTGNFSEIALERETCLRPDLSELILQSTRLSIPAGSGPTAASQNLSVHSFTQPQPNSQKPAMIVNVSKSEDSRGQYNWEEGQTDIDPMSSDVLKSKQTDTPVRSNTNAHPYNTQYATEMRQIAVLQDYEDVMADENVMGDDEDVMGENEAPSVDKDNIESSLENNWISDDKHLRSIFRLNKTRLDFINSLRQSQEWEQRKFDGVLDFNKQGTSSSVTIQSEESDKLLSHMEENQQEWLKYCRAKRSGSQMDMTKEEYSSVAKPRLVTVLDHKGNRITYENYPVLKPTASMHTRTVPESNRQGLSSFLEFSKRWDDTHNADESDLTQSSMDLETLIFSERMNQMLKHKGSSSSRYIRSRHRRSNVEERASTSSPAVTVHFSSLQEDQDGSEEHWEQIPSLAGQKIRVEMPERMAMPEETDGEPQHLKKLSCTKGSEMTHVKVSDLVVDSFRVYHAMMTEVCAGKKYPSRTERLKREDAKRNSSPKSRAPSKDKDFCGQMKEDMYDSLHDNLNSVVRQSCKNKFRFYILVTSSDPFFRETKELLEAEGHIAVEQSQFCLGKDSPLCPLHIILRNEDIAEHICEVPHLLELKKSQNVLFAGIDRPDDIVNLTHQELFSKGGFVVFEGAALHTLSLSNMKKMSGFLEGLSKKGKWKWLLHYRDSRKLKENARSSAEAQGKKIFMDICQEAGMVEVLPYHECDVISRERPNYLHCLVRLQVQNVSARLPVFITGEISEGPIQNSLRLRV
uniref:DUF3715 domain-containing protein n=1 Tax=Oncorhynchus kisutch TaxID=8019 RepID=A0A8C7G7R5_ONCKI